MIKLYCQYNHTGYKKFHFSGQPNELIGRENEVNKANSHHFPEDSNKFIQFDDGKMIYRKLSDGQLFLGIREIPSNKKDSDGRATACAALFIGEDDDRRTLDNLALHIANDIFAFEQFFANLFFIRQGLRIHGDKLRNFIEQHNTNFVVEGKTHPTLLSLSKKQSGVFLFVPFYAKFGSDREITNRICSNQNITKEELRNAIISQEELLRVQKRLDLPWSYQQAPSPLEKENDSEPQNSELLVQDEKEPYKATGTIGNDNQPNTSNDAKINKQPNDNVSGLNSQDDNKQKEDDKEIRELRDNLTKKRNELIAKEQENEELTRQLSFYKKVTYGLAALCLAFLFALIGCNSCSKGGKNAQIKKTNIENDLTNKNYATKID